MANKICDFEEDPVRFFDMEERFDLFSLKADINTPLWDIFRSDIYNLIIYKQAIASKPLKINAIKRLYTSLINILRLLKLLFKKKEVFFFGASRFVDKSGEYYDPYLESVKSTIASRYVFWDTSFFKKRYKEVDFYNIAPTIVKILRFFIYKKTVYSLNQEALALIIRALESTYGSQLISKKHLISMYIDFKLSYLFYSFLFRITKVKIVLLHQNGYQKGLILAARHQKIPVLEFQHADVVEFNVVWHYGYNKFNSTGIIFPDAFLTYSDFWSENNKIPAVCYEIGTAVHNKSQIQSGRKDYFTIISTKEHETEINKITIDLAQSNPELKFLYKLHPAQFADYHQFELLFVSQKNIKVVPVDTSITDLLPECENYIVIYSSVIFELLQAGKKVFIYKKSNYWFFRKFFNLNNVTLFENASEFSKLLPLNTRDKEAPQDVFYKDLNLDIFKLALRDYGLKV